MAIDDITVESKRIEEDSLYSAKGHFSEAAFWSSLHLWMGIPTALLSALAGALALSNVVSGISIAGIIAILVAGLVAVATFLNPSKNAVNHLHAGNNYNALRNDARIFHQIDCKKNLSEEELSYRFERLRFLRDELNRNSPQISSRAFRRAQNEIASGHADYAVDEDA